LGATVILAEAVRSVLQSGAEGLNLAFLRIDLFIQHLIAGSERGGRLVVFIKLRCDQLHFTAQHLERLVNIR
jgi:hypothetical protein